MNKLPFKMIPAFTGASKMIGLAAIGFSNDLRNHEVSIRGTEIGVLMNSHAHSLSSPKDKSPEWRFMLYSKSKAPNIVFKFRDEDLNVMKDWVRRNIENIWEKHATQELYDEVIKNEEARKKGSK